MLKRIALLRQFCDTVWEYQGNSNQLYIYYDGVTPELCDTCQPYEKIYELYRKEFVYSEDIPIWEKYMSPENLREFLESREDERHFEIRVAHGKSGLEWHEAYIDKEDENRLLIGTRDVKEEQRNATIAQAVLPEFDYVCRIEIATGSYVLYYSADEKTVVPQHSADDYETVFTAFNHSQVVPEEADELSENMKIQNVTDKLADQDEYILYATSQDKNGLTYKKFRFCYADATHQELLLTRTDVSDVVRERLLRQEEEKKRLAYLEKELFLTQELHKSQLEMRRILETTTDLMFQYDPEKGALLLDKEETEAYHKFLSEKDLLKKLAKKGYLGENFVDVFEECLARVRDGEHRLSCTIQARKDVRENWNWYKVTLFDYQDDQTQERKVLGYLQNINQDMNVQEKLKQEAQTDSLTGLLNVGAGKKKIRKILKNQLTETTPHNAMFLMDLDDFKGINDTRGHMVGDSTLQAFSGVLKKTFRAKDVVYRLGGDEFAAFVEGVPDTSESIEGIMQRFQKHLENARKEFPFLGVSVGIYAAERRHTYEQYYSEADKALYETKNGGKNHYTIRTDFDTSVVIRRGTQADLVSVEQIYNDIHTAEESGISQIGWIRGVYPTKATAQAALERNDLFVLEEEGKVLGTALINQIQVPDYAKGNWEFEASPEEVCVLHTLVISPEAAGKGYGTKFVKFYENYARSHNCKELRMDTNARNTAARAMYKKLGYKEIGIVPSVFNGIPDVQLVLLEKHLG